MLGWTSARFTGGRNNRARPVLAAVILAGSITCAHAESMQLIPAGTFRPFYTNDGPVRVEAFYLDVHPVTNSEFLEFVQARPEWMRSAVPGLFADRRYLEHWEADVKLGEQAPPDSPVTHVSWYAARAYAEWKGKRLPALAEWEYAAAADPIVRDDDDRTIAQRLISWYSRPSTLPVPRTGTTFENTYGIWDMHGLVWEWIEDFNAVIVSSRTDSSDDTMSRNFCGGGAVGIEDVKNYAAFMRYAFRGSLGPRYTTSQLGFRCVADIGAEP